MRILIFGGTGMLGHKLVHQLDGAFEVFSTIRGDGKVLSDYGIHRPDRTIAGIDVSRPEDINRAIATARPDVVINAVGVIKQLPTAKDVIGTLTVNSIFPQRLAELSAKRGFRLITIGTDCVFDGASGGYTEDDLPNATDLYGQSKRWGEIDGENCLTLRTSIIGRELGTSHSLVEWFLSNHNGRIKGYANAIYSGFPTIVFADIIRDLIIRRKDLCGLYHVSSEPISKLQLLRLINSAYGSNVEIEPFEEFRIDRSLDSSRFRAATGFRPAPWSEMIDRMASDPTPYDKWRTANT